MRRTLYGGEYFDPAATLGCGQAFRWERTQDGFWVFAQDRACLLRREGESTVLECEEGDLAFFENYFDLARDYAAINARVCAFGIPRLSAAARFGRGIRILNQGAEETIFSFIISQNNNIPRIRGILSRLCEALGGERAFSGRTFRAFPSAEALAGQGEAFYRSLGCGYRAPYLAKTAGILASAGRAPLAAAARGAFAPSRRRAEGGGLHPALRLSPHLGVSRRRMDGKGVPQPRRHGVRQRKDRFRLRGKIRRAGRVCTAISLLL